MAEKKEKELIVPIITPLYNRKIDLEGLKKLIDHLIINKVDGVFLMGTTGEFFHHTLINKIKVLEYILKFASNRMKIWVGVSSKEYGECEMFIDYCNKHKVDAVVITPLYGDSKGYKKFDCLVDKSINPVIIYHNPSIQEGEYLDFGFIEKWSKHEKVIGFKDSSADEDYFSLLMKYSKDDFKIYQGKEKFIHPDLIKGVHGLVIANGNIYPKLLKFYTYQPVEEVFFEILKKRKSLTHLAKSNIQKIKKKLVEMGIIRSDELAE